LGILPRPAENLVVNAVAFRPNVQVADVFDIGWEKHFEIIVQFAGELELLFTTFRNAYLFATLDCIDGDFRHILDVAPIRVREGIEAWAYQANNSERVVTVHQWHNQFRALRVPCA